MPPQLFFDPTKVDLTRVCMTKEQIYDLLPHRHEFSLLDGICHDDPALPGMIAFCDVTPEAWWVRGHVPGMPLLPGVLMLEMAAQLSAIQAKVHEGIDGFIAFGGLDSCKFRETVVPPARLYIMSVGRGARKRRVIADAQGVIDGRVIFEARITGLVIN